MKPRKFTRPSRDLLFEKCDQIKALAASMQTNPEKITVLQGGVQSLVRGLDEISREYIYDQVETILLAEEDAGKCLVSSQLLQAFEKYQEPMYVGIKTKHVIDTFIECANAISPELKNDVFRAIILRLMMELPSKMLNEILSKTGPATILEKENSQNRHMYG
jgi:hypothetical protein